MHDEETKQKTQELVRQIQEKSLQLSDLEIILEDYARERTELLREIGRLKASLWELIGDTQIGSSPPASETSANDETKE
jgi:hypothetical protein